MKHLNYVQKMCVDEFYEHMIICNAERGIFSAPTGTGKTGAVRGMVNIYSFMMNHTPNHVQGYSVFLTPRIGLTNQQALALENFRFHQSGIYYDCPITTLVIHSDVPDEVTSEYIGVAISEARNNNLYLLICATYQSAYKLSRFTPDVIFCDEAHHVVATSDDAEIHRVVMDELCGKSKRVFFTATPKEIAGENTKGFNNSKLYGEYYVRVSPKDAISRGLILPPKLHVLYCGSSHKDEDTIIDQVCEIYSFHQAHNTNIPAKVLYSMNGTADVDLVRENWRNIFSACGVSVYTIVSTGNYPGAYINGEWVSRERFFSEIQQNNTGAVVCHYSIISEGIDVESFTGVALMRLLNKTETVQVIGRANRVILQDRDEFGVAKPIEQRLKPHALVTSVVYNGCTTNQNYFHDFLRNIRTAGFEFVVGDILTSCSRSNYDQPNVLPNMNIGDIEATTRKQFVLEYWASILEDDIREMLYKTICTIEAEEHEANTAVKVARAIGENRIVAYVPNITQFEDNLIGFFGE